MSRSKKKPYITQQNKGKPKRVNSKRIANRAVRAKAKLAVRGHENAETADGKAYRKESNPYDIRDWSFHEPENKKAYRK